MDLAADLAVFYGPEFAREFTHAPTGVVFRAIFGAADQHALDGYAITAEFEIQYPSASVTLREGDQVLDSGGDGVPAGTVWQVRENPMRVNDGLESSVLLSRVNL